MIVSTNIVKRSKPIILFLLLLPSIIWGLTFAQGNLGINPIDKLMDELGKMALRLIIVDTYNFIFITIEISSFISKY